MKLGKIFYHIRGSLTKVLFIRRFNPMTRGGRQMIKKLVSRQGLQRASELDLSKGPQAGANLVKPPAALKKLGSFSNPLQRRQSGVDHDPGDSAQEVVTDQGSTHQNGANQGFAQAAQPAPSSAPSSASPVRVDSAVLLPGSNPYPQFQCQRNDPLGCDIAQQTAEATAKAKFCLQCGFPVPLLPRQELRGRRGSYQAVKLLGKRGLGRLYAGIAQSDGQPVVIKEYLLPNRAFGSLDDWQHRQDTFVRMASFRAADGRDQDFRLLPTWDAIADPTSRRCYWIGRGRLGAAPTLGQRLQEQGSLDPAMVRRLLDQVLQTLEFLHQQKFQFATGEARSGLAHGSLSLDSLLMVQNGPDFFVYLCDLGFWETLFDPDQVPGQRFSPELDLKALGIVGFQVLKGGTADPLTGQPLNWRDHKVWPHRDPALQEFLKRLLGLGLPLENATAARQALWELPPVPEQAESLDIGQEAVDPRSRRTGLKRLLILLVVALVGLGVWRLAPWRPATLNLLETDTNRIRLPQLADITDVPSGSFTFSSEVPGIAHRALIQVRSGNPLVGTQNIVEQIQRPFSGLELIHTPTETAEIARQQVQAGSAPFGITHLMESPTGQQRGLCQVPYAETLSRCDLAYDGLMVFVPFIFARRAEGLPRALNGQISFAQLRQLYTGQITNWSQLGGPNRRVQLFAPTEEALVQLFEQRVLGSPDLIEDFRALLADGTIQAQGTFQTMSNIRADFESQPDVGGIAFGSISIVFGDCNVYPLAVAETTTFVNPIVPGSILLARNVRSINPSSNLCQLRGQYFLAESAFRDGHYPLAVPLSLLSLRDNRQEPRFRIGDKVAEMLRSQEGQCLLRSRNLVPLQPVSCE